MKRLFHQTKLYDYSDMDSALAHIEEMRKKGWFPTEQENSDFCRSKYIRVNNSSYPFSVEYEKY